MKIIYPMKHYFSFARIVTNIFILIYN